MQYNLNDDDLRRILYGPSNRSKPGLEFLYKSTTSDTYVGDVSFGDIPGPEPAPSHFVTANGEPSSAAPSSSGGSSSSTRQSPPKAPSAAIVDQLSPVGGDVEETAVSPPPPSSSRRDSNTPAAPAAATADLDTTAAARHTHHQITPQSQPPSPVVVENGDALSITATTTSAPPSWAALFKEEASAKKAIVKQIEHTTTTPSAANQQQHHLSEEQAFQHALAESAKEYEERCRRNNNGVLLNHYDGPPQQQMMNVQPNCDPEAKHLARTLNGYFLQQKGPSFILRGIVNRGNWCYVNATLQALIACPTFFHLLRYIAEHSRARRLSSTPLLDSLAKFIYEFDLVKVQHKTSKQPLDPVYLYEIISQLKEDSSFKGRQEDAEEFLLLALNRMHEEMVAVLALLNENNKANGHHRRELAKAHNETTTDDNDDWHHVGPGGKSAIARKVEPAPSPIRDIYSGQLRYGLSQPSSKESFVFEPFFTLPLDVQTDGVTDLLSALQALTAVETLKNFQGKDKKEVTATRRVTLHDLPRVLIFQLKYFVYTEHGLKKLVKPIAYSMDLQLKGDILSPRSGGVGSGKGSFAPNRYKLFAVVFHHGEKAEGGHYTADVFHGGRWFCMDDTIRTEVDDKHVLDFVPPRVPYLLFYRCMDRKYE